MQGSKVKKMDKHTKKEPTIKFWDDTNKKKYKKITSTTWSYNRIYFHGSNNYGNNDKLNQ